MLHISIEAAARWKQIVGARGEEEAHRPQREMRLEIPRFLWEKMGKNRKTWDNIGKDRKNIGNIWEKMGTHIKIWENMGTYGNMNGFDGDLNH